MFSIRCPLCREVCEDIIYLTLADWGWLGWLPLGKETRLGLVCPRCHSEFLLQVTLSQVITEKERG